jgi:hypothetical protein
MILSVVEYYSVHDGLELDFLYLRCNHSGHGEWKRRKGGKGGKGIETFEKSRKNSRKKVKGRKGPGKEEKAQEKELSIC